MLIILLLSLLPLDCWNHGLNKNYKPTEGGKEIQDNPFTNSKGKKKTGKKKKKKDSDGDMFGKPSW